MNRLDPNHEAERTSHAPTWRTVLPWPIAILDFEASSLDEDSYPIEVGLALWPAPDESILGWSTLICPVGDWVRRGHWSPASAKVHGIRGSDLLAHGQSPERIASALNEALGPGAVAWCDGGPYDAHWARALFKAGGVRQSFALGDWHRLVPLLGAPARERALTWLKDAPTRHRARADAEQLLFALAHAVGVEVGPAQDLAQRLPGLAMEAAT